jgi:hypothetical protein
MTAILIGLVVGLLALLGAAAIKVETLQEVVRSHEGHDDCIKQVAASVSRAHSASLMRHLAHKWDTVEEQGNLQILAREQYHAGGPSMPTLWLRQQADLIERNGA